MTIHAVAEGSVVFPRVPLMRVTGPLIVVQLLETTFLTLVTRIHGADSNCQEAAIMALKAPLTTNYGLYCSQKDLLGSFANKVFKYMSPHIHMRTLVFKLYPFVREGMFVYLVEGGRQLVSGQASQLLVETTCLGASERLSLIVVL